MASSEIIQKSPKWFARTIELRAYLSPKTLNPQTKFYKVVSQKRGTILVKPFFTVTSKDRSSFFRIQIVSENFEKMSFHLDESLKDVSNLVSKLNLASALNCKIVAQLDVEQVVFWITPIDKNSENILIKNYSLFDCSWRGSR